ncbi:phosphatase PAP2 family protein [Microbispora sp. H11081]|uniref:phosphatase PAP2 family protein n=1 Tax=Microbispora sp. H11081 TaxID=2729107 RepID=UPI0028983048|nr:phosphatase PAP2 family protein [Microbispora sp. H11081]
MGTEIEDVPEISVEWYREVTAFAGHTPEWVRQAAEVGTDAILVLLFAFLVFGWWRARREDDRRMALALLAPVAVVAAYVTSEGVKILLQQRRPCWDLTGVATVASCPPYGDWSLPSNHATFAAAAAAALVALWRGARIVAPALAVLAAFSRVFVGVHYPHDVVAGLLLGAVVASAFLLALRGPATTLISSMRRRPVLTTVLTTDRQPAPPRGR